MKSHVVRPAVFLGSTVLSAFALVTPLSAAIVEVQLLGEVTGYTGTSPTGLQAAFPLGTTASIQIEFDDSVANVFPPATAAGGFGGFLAASDITFTVSGETFLLSGADAATAYVPLGSFARYGFGATLGSGTPSGTTGLGFTFDGLGADLSVGHNGPDLLPITSDYVEIVEELVANGGTPIDGTFRLDFLETIDGSIAGGVEFDITDFVSSNVPEPASLALVGAGLSLLAQRRRRTG